MDKEKKDLQPLPEFFEELESAQQPLGEPFATVLFENLWELYAR